MFVNLFSPFPPKVKFCQSFRTRCLCDTGFATMAPITPNTTLHVNKYMKEILKCVSIIRNIYTNNSPPPIPNKSSNIFNHQVSIMIHDKYLLSTIPKKTSNPSLNIIRQKKESIFNGWPRPTIDHHFFYPVHLHNHKISYSPRQTVCI